MAHGVRMRSTEVGKGKAEVGSRKPEVGNRKDSAEGIGQSVMKEDLP